MRADKGRLTLQKRLLSPRAHLRRLGILLLAPARLLLRVLGSRAAALAPAAPAALALLPLPPAVLLLGLAALHVRFRPRQLLVVRLPSSATAAQHEQHGPDDDQAHPPICRGRARYSPLAALGILFPDFISMISIS